MMDLLPVVGFRGSWAIGILVTWGVDSIINQFLLKILIVGSGILCPFGFQPVQIHGGLERIGRSLVLKKGMISISIATRRAPINTHTSQVL